ncbi:hypothetical protein [Paraglaciecola sp.]|uniref:hypothetical protein n=1 Tax=Paraglaciecola sp. TaxID=1920173 RepID=UPI003EF5A892
MKSQNTFFKALLAVSIFLLSTFSKMGHANTTYSGTVNILPGNAQFVSLSPAVLVYPGETVKFTMSGSVNVNHHHYEVRRCKYFGLKCWYENRARPNHQDHTAFEIEVYLVDSAGNVVGNPQVFKGNNPNTWQITYNKRMNRLEAASVHAYVKSYTGGGIHRTPCSPGRPRYCSSGGLRMQTAEIISTERKNVLKTEIKNQGKLENINSLIPEHYQQRVALDPLLLHSSGDRKAVQKFFADQMSTWVENGAESAQQRVIEVIKGSIALHTDAYQVTQLNSALMQSYAKQGRYEKVQQMVGDSLKTAKKTCADPNNGNCTLAAAQTIADIYVNGANSFLENRARMNAGDIQIAANYYRAGIILVGKVLDRVLNMNNSQRKDEVKNTTKRLATLLAEMARALMIVRTRSDIENAKTSLDNATCLMSMINDERSFKNDYNTWRKKLKSQCVAKIFQ